MNARMELRFPTRRCIISSPQRKAYRKCVRHVSKPAPLPGFPHFRRHLLAGPTVARSTQRNLSSASRNPDALHNVSQPEQPTTPSNSLQFRILAGNLAWVTFLTACAPADADTLVLTNPLAKVDLLDFMLHQPLATLSLSLIVLFTLPKVIQGVLRRFVYPVLFGLGLGIAASNPEETAAVTTSVVDFVQGHPVASSVVILAISALALTPYILVLGGAVTTLYAFAAFVPVDLPLPPLPSFSPQNALFQPAQKMLSDPFSAVTAASRLNKVLDGVESGNFGQVLTSAEAGLTAPSVRSSGGGRQVVPDSKVQVLPPESSKASSLEALGRDLNLVAEDSISLVKDAAAASGDALRKLAATENLQKLGAAATGSLRAASDLVPADVVGRVTDVAGKSVEAARQLVPDGSMEVMKAAAQKTVDAAGQVVNTENVQKLQAVAGDTLEKVKQLAASADVEGGVKTVQSVVVKGLTATGQGIEVAKDFVSSETVQESVVSAARTSIDIAKSTLDAAKGIVTSEGVAKGAENVVSAAKSLAQSEEVGRVRESVGAAARSAMEAAKEISSSDDAEKVKGAVGRRLSQAGEGVKGVFKMAQEAAEKAGRANAAVIGGDAEAWGQEGVVRKGVSLREVLEERARVQESGTDVRMGDMVFKFRSVAPVAAVAESGAASMLMLPGEVDEYTTDDLLLSDSLLVNAAWTTPAAYSPASTASPSIHAAPVMDVAWGRPARPEYVADLADIRPASVQDVTTATGRVEKAAEEVLAEATTMFQSPADLDSAALKFLIAVEKFESTVERFERIVSRNALAAEVKAAAGDVEAALYRVRVEAATPEVQDTPAVAPKPAKVAVVKSTPAPVQVAVSNQGAASSVPVSQVTAAKQTVADEDEGPVVGFLRWLQVTYRKYHGVEGTASGSALSTAEAPSAAVVTVPAKAAVMEAPAVMVAVAPAKDVKVDVVVSAPSRDVKVDVVPVKDLQVDVVPVKAEAPAKVEVIKETVKADKPEVKLAKEEVKVEQPEIKLVAEEIKVEKADSQPATAVAKVDDSKSAKVDAATPQVMFVADKAVDKPAEPTLAVLKTPEADVKADEVVTVADKAASGEGEPKEWVHNLVTQLLAKQEAEAEAAGSDTMISDLLISDKVADRKDSVAEVAGKPDSGKAADGAVMLVAAKAEVGASAQDVIEVADTEVEKPWQQVLVQQVLDDANQLRSDVQEAGMQTVSEIAAKVTEFAEEKMPETSSWPQSMFQQFMPKAPEVEQAAPQVAQVQEAVEKPAPAPAAAPAAVFVSMRDTDQKVDDVVANFEEASPVQKRRLASIQKRLLTVQQRLQEERVKRLEQFVAAAEDEIVQAAANAEAKGPRVLTVSDKMEMNAEPASAPAVVPAVELKPEEPKVLMVVSDSKPEAKPVEPELKVVSDTAVEKPEALPAVESKPVEPNVAESSIDEVPKVATAEKLMDDAVVAVSTQAEAEEVPSVTSVSVTKVESEASTNEPAVTVANTESQSSSATDVLIDGPVDVAVVEEGGGRSQEPAPITVSAKKSPAAAVDGLVDVAVMDGGQQQWSPEKMQQRKMDVMFRMMNKVAPAAPPAGDTAVQAVQVQAVQPESAIIREVDVAAGEKVQNVSSVIKSEEAPQGGLFQSAKDWLFREKPEDPEKWTQNKQEQRKQEVMYRLTHGQENLPKPEQSMAAARSLQMAANGSMVGAENPEAAMELARQNQQQADMATQQREMEQLRQQTLLRQQLVQGVQPSLAEFTSGKQSGSAQDVDPKAKVDMEQQRRSDVMFRLMNGGGPQQLTQQVQQRQADAPQNGAAPAQVESLPAALKVESDAPQNGAGAPSGMQVVDDPFPSMSMSRRVTSTGPQVVDGPMPSLPSVPSVPQVLPASTSEKPAVEKPKKSNTKIPAVELAEEGPGGLSRPDEAGPGMPSMLQRDHTIICQIVC